jgi:SAM-dependent methyltransferase
MNNDLSSQYWNNRYLQNEFAWDIGYASPALVQFCLGIKDKNSSILIPGSGNSYEAEYLFNNGFKNVSVLDFAAEPLKTLKLRCPNFPEDNLICQDFFHHHHHQYDLILEQTFFCALNPSLRNKYVEHMHTLLKPNGKLVGVMFNVPLNDDKPPFGGNTKEYEKIFYPYFNILKMETCYNSIKPREGNELFVIFEPKSII